MFEDQPLPSTSSSYFGEMEGVSQTFYGLTEYGSQLSLRILSSNNCFSSLFSTRSDSPEPISAEDDLENQDTIMMDDGILEVEGDIDLPDDMPHLQDVSDDEDDGKQITIKIPIYFIKLL